MVVPATSGKQSATAPERPISGHHQQAMHLQQQQQATAQQLEDHGRIFLDGGTIQKIVRLFLVGIYGTLYNDLLSERHVWTSDMDFFGGNGPPTAGVMFNGSGAMSFEPNGSAGQQVPLYNGGSNTTFNTTRGRPNSLPQDLRGNFANMGQYRNVNGFGNGTPQQMYSPMFNGDGNGGGYGEGMVNGGHRSRVSPLENEVSWNQHEGFGAGGYGEDFGGRKAPWMPVSSWGWRRGWPPVCLPNKTKEVTTRMQGNRHSQLAHSHEG